MKMDQVADFAVRNSRDVAAGAAIFIGAMALALIALAIAFTFSQVKDKTWQNILLVVLSIAGIVVIIAALIAIFRRFSCKM